MKVGTTAVAGAKLTFTPAGTAALTSDAAGAFSAADLPIGAYSVKVEATGYETQIVTLHVAAGLPATLDVVLKPTKPVVVNAGTDRTAAPGGTVALQATSTTYDGSTGDTYSWKQVSGVPVTIAGADTATPTITLPTLAQYKAAIVAEVKPRDLTKVLGVSPFAIETAETAELELTVTTTSGKYTDTVLVKGDAGVAPSQGLRNVPLGVPLLLQAKKAASYSWTVSGPASPTLIDPTTQWPTFTPPAQGTYTLTETVSGASMTISAGKWVGSITGLDPTDGLPLSDGCSTCHNDNLAANQFKDWRKTGHARILQQNLDDPDHHWTTNCASCHTVGYDTRTSANNDGFDDKAAFEGWTTPKGPGSYAAMFTNGQEETAQRGNVQCESCHGPNNSAGHTTSTPGPTMDVERRISLSSEVCGTCHGEPPRHGRYQQWQDSGHASMEYVSEGTVEARGTTAAHCGRCHTGEGFINWVAQGDNLNHNIYSPGTTNPATEADLRAMGLTNASAHGQTCATCHDPHASGTTSADANDAGLRVQGTTGMLPSGFRAVAVGNGALCMTCHNTRNGLRDDAHPPTSYGGPHAPSQADVLMGYNAYFVTPGIRGAHSYIENTCTNCHMQLTDPPPDLSYNRSGTNHSFHADLGVCANCHGEFEASGIQTAMTELLVDLGEYIGTSAVARLNALGTIYVRAEDEATGTFSSTGNTDANVMITTSTNPVKSIHAAISHGQMLFEVTLTNAITYTDTRGAIVTTDHFAVELRALKSTPGAAGAAVYPAAGNMVKAMWNMSILQGDGSLGVHNPAFFTEVVQVTLTKDLSL